MWNGEPESGRSKLRVIPFQLVAALIENVSVDPSRSSREPRARLLLWPRSCAALKPLPHEALIFSPSSFLPSCFPSLGKPKYLATYKIKILTI